MYSRQETAIIKRALNILRKKGNQGILFDGADKCKPFFQTWLGPLDRECFGVVFLDNAHKHIHEEILFEGSVNTCNVHPAVIARKALLHNSSTVMLAHNHPGGQMVASDADKSITNDIVKVLELVDVHVLDHFIVGHDDVFSFMQHNLFNR